MKKISLFVIFLGSFLASCTKDEIKIDSNNPLIGVWNYSEFQDNASVFTRSRDFNDNHCYKFNTDGTLVERKNSGWCGTPPISYSDYSGSWTFVNDTLIEINSAYWGGSLTYRLDIESVSVNSLKVVTVSDNN